MPLFFIVSGVVVRKHQTTKYDLNHYKDFLSKNFFALMVSYFMWALIYSKFSWKNIPYILYGSWQTLTLAQTLTSLWFLPCLFLARIEMELILHSSNLFPKVNRHVYALIWSVIAFAIGFNLPNLEMGYPLCFNISLVALGYMLIGYAYKEYLNKLEDKSIIYQIVMLITYVGLYVFGITCKDKPFLILMCGAQYGDIALLLLNSLSGCGIVITISVIISKYLLVDSESRIRKLMLWIGRNTIGIYLIHKPLLQEVVVSFLVGLGYSTNSFGVAIFAAIIVFPACLLIVYIINKYLPSLFGKRVSSQ